MSLALLLTTAAATAVGAAALHAAHGLRTQVAALRTELAETRAAGAAEGQDSAASAAAVVPRQTVRSAEPAEPAAEIRAAVAEALAEERERELAEARAFWAAQEARDAADAPSLLGGVSGPGEELPPFYVPRQADFAGLEAVDFDAVSFDPAEAIEDQPEVTEFAEDSPELAAARRRHPSHPDFVPVQTPVVTDHERTVARLEELAETRAELADVRPGPLGTLDVYVFADGTTLCMTPGHRETAERLADALRDGDAPVLLGGSGVSGAYALTFACGDDSVYILADRVIASL
ncbi:hypothetical protein [Streptomyces sp. MUM 178J]|uniref:hypothetical protein n=1 Tax=Streptomyces sp. MUM 178J TaxID=2791991 RepID=UPI001F0358D8|nr:hypothetical protein [Streptomyces sp. MUM 178J]WRQ83341.1 hypothetical protein I3F59_010585 [Streptomyces sp. MUM 178J]